MADFQCRECGRSFSLSQRVLDQYPGWTPPLCMDCRNVSLGGSTGGGTPSRTKNLVLTTDEVLAQFSAGPSDGVFTDGGSVPNPGPGGWGAVYVVADEIVAEASGREPDTTNNRMELTALIEAAGLVPVGAATVVYSDSNIAVRTITEWAEGWERRGWRRKTGPVENLELVQAAYAIYDARPELQLEWIAAHSGYKWNEYADALASRWRLSGA